MGSDGRSAEHSKPTGRRIRPRLHPGWQNQALPMTAMIVAEIAPLVGWNVG